MSKNALQSYQDQASTFATLHTNIDTLFIGLSAETGELCSERMREIRTDRTPVGVHEIESELGDILWYVSVIATKYNLDLSEIANRNLVKLILRKQKEENNV